MNGLHERIKSDGFGASLRFEKSDYLLPFFIQMDGKIFQMRIFRHCNPPVYMLMARRKYNQFLLMQVVAYPAKGRGSA